ncbi:MAG: hypothetical protein ABW104_12930 [Candidatus Thiodiazotropha sp. 6PLUC2]
MTLQRHRISVLLLALLLLQAPIVMAWSHGCGTTNDQVMNQMSEQIHTHCHEVESAIELADCENMNCVFCGFTVQFDLPAVTLTVSHVLYIAEPSFPAPPRSEQPVELRPPIVSYFV